MQSESTNEKKNKRMPLHDHFRSPMWEKGSWEGFHGGWPMMIAQELNKVLPSRYSAEPRVHLGTNFEIDVCVFEPGSGVNEATAARDDGGPGIATATWAPAQPTLRADADPTEMYQYEVLVFDRSRARELVAAIEIASPGNQDRPSARRAFVSKCAALLQQRVCVSMIDLVTTRRYNLYCELLDSLEVPDRTICDAPSPIYAATCRGRKVKDRRGFETWAYTLQVGERLPKLPVWLDDDVAVPLDLESSCMAACEGLRLL